MSVSVSFAFLYMDKKLRTEDVTKSRSDKELWGLTNKITSGYGETLETTRKASSDEIRQDVIAWLSSVKHQISILRGKLPNSIAKLEQDVEESKKHQKSLQRQIYDDTVTAWAKSKLRIEKSDLQKSAESNHNEILAMRTALDAAKSLDKLISDEEQFLKQFPISNGDVRSRLINYKNIESNCRVALRSDTAPSCKVPDTLTIKIDHYHDALAAIAVYSEKCKLSAADEQGHGAKKWYGSVEDCVVSLSSLGFKDFDGDLQKTRDVALIGLHDFQLSVDGLRSGDALSLSALLLATIVDMLIFLCGLALLAPRTNFLRLSKIEDIANLKEEIIELTSAFSKIPPTTDIWEAKLVQNLTYNERGAALYWGYVLYDAPPSGGSTQVSNAFSLDKGLHVGMQDCMPIGKFISETGISRKHFKSTEGVIFRTRMVLALVQMACLKHSASQIVHEMEYDMGRSIVRRILDVYFPAQRNPASPVVAGHTVTRTSVVTNTMMGEQ